jgi:protein-disulfide isomerase
VLRTSINFSDDKPSNQDYGYINQFMGEKYMSNKALAFITALNLIISLTALWVASPLASTVKLREKFTEVFTEAPDHLFEIAVKGGEVHRQKQEEKEQQAQLSKLGKVWTDLISTPSPFSGGEKGSATIVSFYDYSCGYCRKAHDVVEQLLKEDPSLKVIYKPVAIFSSPLIIQAALAAHKQGKFKAIHDALMTENVDPTKDTLARLAQKLGLDVQKFLKDLESDVVKKEIAATQSIYQELRLMGTPTYIIEQTAVVPGHIEIDEFKKLLNAIKTERAKAAANKTAAAA